MNDQKNILPLVTYRLIVFALTILILTYAKSVLLPLAFGVIFSLALVTPANYLERKGLSRSLSATVCLILALIALSGVFVFISSQILHFEKDFPLLESKFLRLIEQLQHFVQDRLHVSEDVVQENLSPILNDTIAMAPNIIGALVGFLSNSLFIAGFTFIYTLMILVYRENISIFFNATFRHIESVSKLNIANKTQFVIKNYITGLLMEMVFVATTLSIGFLITGAKYAILLAVISAIMNLVPYLGFISAAVLSVIITFATNSPNAALWVGIISVGVHLIDSNIFLPAVVGNKVSINALATVIGVFVGSLIWGIPGMFLAVPTVAIIKVICDEIPRLQHWGILMGGRVKVVKIRKRTVLKLPRP